LLSMWPSGMSLHWWCSWYENMDNTRRYSEIILDGQQLHQLCNW
jgi:hypothetical protein